MRWPGPAGLPVGLEAAGAFNKIDWKAPGSPSQPAARRGTSGGSVRAAARHGGTPLLVARQSWSTELSAWQINLAHLHDHIGSQPPQQKRLQRGKRANLGGTSVLAAAALAFRRAVSPGGGGPQWQQPRKQCSGSGAAKASPPALSAAQRRRPPCTAVSAPKRWHPPRTTAFARPTVLPACLPGFISAQELDLVRLKREAKAKGGFYVEPEAKVVFVVSLKICLFATAPAPLASLRLRTSVASCASRGGARSPGRCVSGCPVHGGPPAPPSCTAAKAARLGVTTAVGLSACQRLLRRHRSIQWQQDSARPVPTAKRRQRQCSSRQPA